MIGQVDVAGAKTNEPACARDLLETLDLDGRTVTADALHTVKATAELIHARGGHFLFPVKENPRSLFDALNTLPWPRVPVAASRIDTSHGRITRRTIQVLPAPPDLPFPHVNQIWLIERYVTDAAGRNLSAAAQLGVASHTPEQARPAQIAAFNQGHWAIESLHWIRDTCYREDASQPGPYPQRTPCPGLHAQPGHQRPTPGRTLRHITEATRWASRNMTRPFTILGLAS
ncbi:MULTISPECIES: ISAs1 family transposase [Micromonospora]|uniref:ISAs1 family transposase n=1 Tax=Micromonospora TaxID=1873 RepID=UPI00131A0BF0|nr:MULTISPECIES: ISAs1 family transposase [Micromonospora]NES17336.1 ISAs1 family transposase [Micromonospora sp. PPF5-17B]NES39832.1 ISAs1 family transposase [Micromonospora solifontis]NES59183.1 ISAs1 family transposase [Micromonospora sp. PPF5-6]